jgi:hypothetical protein
MFNLKRLIVRVALLGAVTMASGCALGVDKALIDDINGLSIARGNAMDRFDGGEFPGNGGRGGGSNTGSGDTGSDTGGGNATTAGNGGGGNGGLHANSGGGNGSEGDPDKDPGKGNEKRSDKSKGKDQEQD